MLLSSTGGARDNVAEPAARAQGAAAVLVEGVRHGLAPGREERVNCASGLACTEGA